VLGIMELVMKMSDLQETLWVVGLMSRRAQLRI